MVVVVEGEAVGHVVDEGGDEAIGDVDVVGEGGDVVGEGEAVGRVLSELSYPRISMSALNVICVQQVM